MNSYVIVWQDQGYSIASIVEIPADKNPEDLKREDWISLAAAAEGCDEEEIAGLIEEGFTLHAVMKGEAEDIIM